MSEEPRKISVEILAEHREIEATDCWLRVFAQLAWAEPQNYFFHNGYYCWNNRCLNCLFDLERQGQQQSLQACHLVPQHGDSARSLPKFMKRLDPHQDPSDTRVETDSNDLDPRI
jgi:hypothetical protein